MGNPSIARGCRTDATLQIPERAREKSADASESNAARLAAGPTPFSIEGTFTGFEVPKAADGYLAGPDLVNYRWAFARGAVNLSRGILEAALRARCASHSENLITLILFWILAIAASSVYQHKRYDTASGMLADHR